MTETQPSESDALPESEKPSVTHVSGGVQVEARGDVVIGGDVVGRDKIVQQIEHFHERSLTAVEEARQRRDFEARYLAEGISALTQKLRTEARLAPDAQTPYRGLLEYRLSDAAIFQGREHAIAEMLQHLESGSLTVLHSESGAGKTSLLQAGLAPRLIAAGHLPIYLRPYNADPAVVMKRAFVSVLSLTPLLAAASLHDFLRQVCAVLGAPTVLYVMLDQFEEFFTRLDDPTLRAGFIGELAECLDDPQLSVRWLLSIRADYFSNLATFQPRVRDPFANQYRLNRLTRAEAQAVMVVPIERRGLRFEDGLVDRLLDDLGKDQIAPPQLQLVCAELYRALPKGETIITAALHEREGGTAGILGGYLERVLSRELPSGERKAARHLLESLITSEQQRVIRTHEELVAELTRRGITPQTLDVILNQLIDRRLIKVDDTDAGFGYELAHDYLLSEIQLAPEVRDRKAAQELLEQEVRAFDRYGSLLSEDRLALIEKYRTELTFTPRAEQLSAASQAKIERDRRQRRVTRVALGVALAAIAVFLLVIGPGQALYHELLHWQAGQANPLIELQGGDMIFGTDFDPPDFAEAISETVPVSTFRIDEHEVTNAQYDQCMRAGGCPTGPSDRKFFDKPEFADHPVVYVNAFQAAAYCRWLGRRLPDEWEWEFAARGSQGELWPWGNTAPAPSSANLVTGTQTLRVRSFPRDQRAGVFDLTGNVQEWTMTVMQFDEPALHYERAGKWNGVDDLPLAVRGGAYSMHDLLRLTAAAVPYQASMSDSETIGFRCAQGAAP